MKVQKLDFKIIEFYFITRLLLLIYKKSNQNLLLDCQADY